MNDHYKRYGFQEVLNDNGGRVSRGFREYCTRGYLEYLGAARNVSRTYASKQKDNVTFKNYLIGCGVQVPLTHSMARPSLPAMYQSISKYDKGEPSLREDVCFQRAVSWTVRRYATIMGMSKVMTTEEVLVEMDKTTSCGYPWNILYKDKNEFIESESVHILEDFFSLTAKSDCQVQAIWKVAQKNELLPKEKIDANKIRTFTAAPIEFSVLANRLFLDQNRKMNDNHILRNECSTSFIGATKFGGGWNSLYRHLRRKFRKAYELDESAYDASVFKAIFMAIRDFRWKCLDKTGWSAEKTEEMWNRVCHVYSSIVHSLVVLEDGSLVRKNTGNPSGSTNTINDNTLALDILFNYAWLSSCMDNKVETDYDHFNANVCPVLNGDDNTYTVSDECEYLLTPKAVKGYWDPLSVITKTPSEEPREVENVSFLSQGFHQCEGKFYPLPDKDKVLCSLLYASSTQDIRWHYLRAAALRIESYWNVECRNLIWGYLCYLEQNFRSELCGEIRDLKWEHIRALFTSDEDIEALYSGKEACGLGHLKMIEIMKQALLDE